MTNFSFQSTSSADLTTKLQSEQHGSKDVAEKLSTVQLELEETKVKVTKLNHIRRTCNRYKQWHLKS